MKKEIFLFLAFFCEKTQKIGGTWLLLHLGLILIVWKI